MGDRVYFQSRTLGCVVDDSGAVSILDPRFKFRRGWETGGTDPADGSVECGDDTEFPMLVTLAQLFELMYRVKDSKWLSGTATQDYDGVGETAIVTFTSATPASEKVEWELQSGDTDAAYCRRGYAAVNNDETPDQPMEDYDDTFFSEVQYLTVGGILGGDTYPLAFRETKREFALWANNSAADPKEPLEIGHLEAGEILDDLYIGPGTNDTFKTGFSLFAASHADGGLTPTIYAPYSAVSGTPELGAEVSIVFNGEVAWVDENGSGDPLDPLNKLYVGISFWIRNSFRGNIAGIDEVSHSTRTDDLYTPSSKLADLKLKLSDGSYVTAAIYGEEELGSTSATDWVFEATEWWPYETLGGDPAWDSATGEPINNGPGG